MSCFHGSRGCAARGDSPALGFRGRLHCQQWLGQHNGDSDELDRVYTHRPNTAGIFTRAVGVQVGSSPLPILISELVAENKYSLKDGDGDASDWIELRNTATLRWISMVGG